VIFLGLRELHSDFTFDRPGGELNSSNWSSAFTLSKGADADIDVGMPVVTEAGILVGQVSEVGDNWANVRPVIDVETNVGVLVGEAGNAAMAIGDFALMQTGCCKLNHLTEGPALERTWCSPPSGAAPSPRPGGGLYRVRLTEAGGRCLWRAAPRATWTASHVFVTRT
jgi:rod shape-determining protein MreC